jgi:hypothetical protein
LCYSVRLESGTKRRNGMNGGVDGFIERLSESTGEDLPVECIEDTYEVESDTLTLTFTFDGEFFEIRSIDVHGNNGLGKKVVNSIHQYADEEGLEVIASNVRDHARGFWMKMGYREGQIEDEYFRAA